MYYVGKCETKYLQERWQNGAGYYWHEKLRDTIVKNWESVEHYICRVPIGLLNFAELYFIAHFDSVKNGLNTKFSN
ncbi:MAG: hypothetical protein MJ197_08705 [Bacteroidales bacterium]|nr:hypothetical protein [Bacteroidales bacterium]